MEHDSRQPPLTPDEDARLRRHERWMTGTFIVSMVLFVAFLLHPFGAQAAKLTWLGAVALVFLSGGLQFLRRCPRCGANIGTQTRLRRPAACRRCGTRLRP